VIEKLKQSHPKIYKHFFTVTTFSKLVALSLFIILPFVGFYLGMKYQEMVTVATTPVVSCVQNITVKNSTTPIPTSTAVANPTVGWKTLIAGKISIKYPSEWTYKLVAGYGQPEIYNPNSMENVVTNGGIGNQHAYISVPDQYVFINSITASSKTALQEAQDYKQQWVNLGSDSTILGSKIVNGIDYALYTDQGEASRFNDLAISNGKILIKINTSMKSLDGNATENQIISTLNISQ